MTTPVNAPVTTSAEPLVGEIVTDIPTLKAGWRTSEFWLTLVTTVISLLVGLGYLGPDFAKRHEAIVNALCLLAATVAPAIYAVARNIAKGKHQAAAGHVAATRITYAQPAPPIAAPKTT